MSLDSSIPVCRIQDLSAVVGQNVRLNGWLYNRRSKGKIHFLQVRDGSGIVQCVGVKGELSDADFEAASGSNQEASLSVTGLVRADDRAPGGVELARNDMGLQAAEIRQGGSVVWAVQYHPEYTLREIAATARRYGDALVSDGFFRDLPDILTFSSELDELHAMPGNRMLAWRYGLGPGVVQAAQRLAELRNWLAHQVLKRPRT